MSHEEDFARRMAATFPPMLEVLSEHLSSEEGELLPYLFLGDVASWLDVRARTEGWHSISPIMRWLEVEYGRGSFEVRNLIDVGLIEMLPASPDGDPVLSKLGPQLRHRAQVAGLMPRGEAALPDDSERTLMSASQELMHDLVAAFPETMPLLIEHRRDQEGELLPYLLMADIARWAESTSITDPARTTGLTTWLEARFDAGDDALKDLIGVGFVEMISQSPEGDPILDNLGPSLRHVAGEMGLLYAVKASAETSDPWRDAYPALWHLLGAYLHQDWASDYTSPMEAASDFMEGEPFLSPRLAEEIDRLLASTRTAQDVETAIISLGSFFVPSRRGTDAREWLRTLQSSALSASRSDNTRPRAGQVSKPENLKYLLAAYFHQDWNHTHSTWEEVVDEYVNLDPSSVQGVTSEIDVLLSSPLDDTELDQELMRMGCAFDPPGGDRAWLRALRDRIRRLTTPAE